MARGAEVELLEPDAQMVTPRALRPRRHAGRRAEGGQRGEQAPFLAEVDVRPLGPAPAASKRPQPRVPPTSEDALAAMVRATSDASAGQHSGARSARPKFGGVDGRYPLRL